MQIHCKLMIKMHKYYLRCLSQGVCRCQNLLKFKMSEFHSSRGSAFCHTRLHLGFSVLLRILQDGATEWHYSHHIPPDKQWHRLDKQWHRPDKQWHRQESITLCWIEYCQAQSSSSFSFAEQTELALFSTNPADT